MTSELSALLGSDLARLAGAAGVDWFLGEPAAALHPVVWIGRVARAAERLARATCRGPLAELVAGAAIALVVPGLFAGGAALLLRVLAPWPLLGCLLAIWLLKSIFALRALGSAARDVRGAIARGELAQARRHLGNLCSRDASALDEAGVVAGVVESLAENASDSVVAPVFYFVLFGLPGAIFYRAVNTLDAMIGYHGRYEYLGKAAARLDDLVNLLPARLTAALLLIGGAATGGDLRHGWSIAQRDGGKTESPNAGWPMAAMAGLLRVRLEKKDQYRLGDPIVPLTSETIDAAWRVVTVAAALAFAAALAALAVRSAAGLLSMTGGHGI